MSEGGDGVVGCDLFGDFRGGTEEGIDVEAGEGGDVRAMAFAGLGFWWDCRLLGCQRALGGVCWGKGKSTFLDVCGFN